jgi:hypothetical protein
MRGNTGGRGLEKKPAEAINSKMLLHIRPRIYCPFVDKANHQLAVKLVELTLEPLGIYLRDGIELATGRPYPNKGYIVACRRQRSRKASDGILIETDRPTGDLIYTAKWAVDAELVVTHRIQYRLLDQDFDAATDAATLWCAWSAFNGKDWPGPWPDRRPAWVRGLVDLAVEPCMQIRSPTENERLEADREKASHQNQLTDTLDEDGIIIERREIFSMPTIERERLTDPRFNQTLNMRLPQIEMVFPGNA